MKIIQVSLRSRFIETLLQFIKYYFRSCSALSSAISKLTFGKGLLENQEIVLVAALNFRSKIKVRNQTILPCNCSNVFVLICFWASTSSMFWRSSADLSGCFPPGPAFSVSTTSSSVLNLSQKGGAFPS